MSKYPQIITKLFDANSAFISEDFYEFVGEITKKYPSDRSKILNKDTEGYEYIREYITTFEDDNGDKLAIMTYKMPSKTKVERARSEQRNLISTYLKNEGVFESINSVLVAFYSDDSNDWRLSFIKQEFKLSETELDSKGRPKIVNELTPAKRYSFLVESNSKNLTVKQRLNDLIQEKIFISDIEKAFSVEKVSKEFFEKYVGLYNRLAKAFEKDEVFKKIEEVNSNGDEHFRENFVKKLLGQIVFLYFLQKKGWLGVKKDEKWGDGDKNFLQNLLKECLEGGNPKKESGGKNFFNDYLEYLFYAFLNEKEENRDKPDYFNCRIPYLNGGLFQENYKWKGDDNILLAGDDNNAIFRDIFETFDEYNFTVYENDPLEQDVAVDPEMLGKVFENLLPENERKGKGAFYTPREIVHYMCKESLKNHLMNKTGISEELIENLFTYKDSYFNITKRGNKNLEKEKFEIFEKFYEFGAKINESLISVKIVDPAVGSGAFPMGLLKEIVSIRRFIEENVLRKENVSEYTLKKETLENCIYGVDIDPGAVEIAKLRFWLSLVIEEDSKESIDTLPNLDYKIIQGNSLIEDIIVGDTVIKLDIENSSKKLTKKEENSIGNAGQIVMGLFTDAIEQDDILKKLNSLHKGFFQEIDNIQKKKIKNEIDHVEKELIRISGELQVNKLRTKIESIQGRYLLSGLTPEPKDINEIEKLNIQIGGIKGMEEKYMRDNIRTFFPWKLHFAEVFNENGGFDIVIGNPPYIDSEEMAKSQLNERDYISNNFEFTKGNWDIYIAFFEIGYRFLSKKGILTYITPDKWLSKPFGNTLRQKLLLNIGTIIKAGRKVFETAKVDSIITFIHKNNVKNINVMEYSNDTFNYNSSINKDLIKFPYILDFIFSDYIRIINKVNGVNSILGEIGVCENACATSDAYKLKDFIFNSEDFNQDYLKIINTGTLGKYINKWGIKEMTYLKDKYLYPVVNKNDFLNIFNNSYGKKAIKPKIIIKGLNLLDGALDLNGEYIPGKTTIIIHCENADTLKFLSGYINSKLPIFYIKQVYSSSSYNGGICFTKDMIDLLPIPKMSSEFQKPFIDLVDQILEVTKNEEYLKREDLQKQVKILEKKIDDLVYDLYGLTPDEIDLIEESLKK